MTDRREDRKESRGPGPPRSYHSQPGELTVPSALGKEKQDREQQLHILLKLLLKMTRHFTGKVTTIWALGAADEARAGAVRLWSPPPSRPGSEK